jgi:hypothetical protein
MKKINYEKICHKSGDSLSGVNGVVSYYHFSDLGGFTSGIFGGFVAG